MSLSLSYSLSGSITLSVRLWILFRTICRMKDFLSWAGSDGVRVLRNSSSRIPHFTARPLLCLQHLTWTYVHTCAYSHTFLGRVESFCVTWQLGRSSLLSERAAVDKGSLSLSVYVYMHTWNPVIEGNWVKAGNWRTQLYVFILLLICFSFSLSWTLDFIILDTRAQE